MNPADYVSILVDLLVVIFLGWFLIVRRGIDQRIAKLAETLTSVSDIISSNFSWKRTAEEIRAVEEALTKKHEIEKDVESKVSLGHIRKAKIEHVHTEADFRILAKLIQTMVPEETRRQVADTLEAQGEKENSRVLKALRGEPLSEKSANT